jgi:epoxyqueuosine reductase QueG
MEEKIWQLVLQYAEENRLELIWRKPLVRFADARHSGFEALKQIVDPQHHLPQDFLPGAKTVISWFLPFEQDLAQSNLDGRLSSARWADAYLVTNEMAAWINEELVSYIQKDLGTSAAIVNDAGMISEDNPRSRWSQRHVAYLAGQGTFGLNNMLISDAGSVGRYFSLVTTLNVVADTPVVRERCLWKREGACGLCVRRCDAQALTTEGFDRFKCLERCLENMQKYPGADVCGKCTVELPCSYRIPE